MLSTPPKPKNNLQPRNITVHCIHIYFFSPGDPCPEFTKWHNTINHCINNRVHKSPHIGMMTDLFLCLFQTFPWVYIHCLAKVTSDYSSSLLFTGEEASRDSSVALTLLCSHKKQLYSPRDCSGGQWRSSFSKPGSSAMVSLICKQWVNYMPSGVDNSTSIRHRFWERSFYLRPMN